MTKLQIAVFVFLLTIIWYSCKADELLGTYHLTRYYSPAVWQTKYYKNRSYDIMMNCGGTSEEWCKYPADWVELINSDVWVALACPSNIKLGTKLRLEFHWGSVEWICRDRGWAIKNKRLDSRCGYGDEWIDNIKNNTNCYTWKAKVYKVTNRVDEPMELNHWKSNEKLTYKEIKKSTPVVKVKKICRLVSTIKQDDSYVQVDTLRWQLINWIRWLNKWSKVFVCKDIQ